jgi:hypothetical protein
MNAEDLKDIARKGEDSARQFKVDVRNADIVSYVARSQ